MAGNTQSAMAGDAYKTAAAIKKNPNARSAAKKKDEKVTKTATLSASISAINQRIIGPAKAAITAAEPTVNTYQKAYTAYTRLHKDEPGYPSPTDTSTLNAILSVMAPAKDVIKKNTKIITDANNDINKIKKQIADINPSTKVYTQAPPAISRGGSGADKTAPKGNKKAFSKNYKYNAPMVKSAYFGSSSFQSNLLNNNHVDQGAYTDARRAWEGVNGGRGTIQMDKVFLTTIDTTTLGDNVDTQKYGFKFLYNPTTVSMAWGLMSSMDPNFEASGKDAFAVVSAGLLSSTVDFEIILNRIEDFNYIDENGIRTTTTTVTNGTNYITQRTPDFDPYPTTIDSTELQDIYRKGTMYDLEYLLKTLNGPSATFVSNLNGSTADRAWLRPNVVELHLGDSMRYRVRIASLSVNHIMFNSRMVPIFSSVKFTCARFNDGPVTMSGQGTGVNKQIYGISDPAKLAALNGKKK